MANNCTAHLWRGGNLSLDKTEGGMAEDGLMPILIFLCVLRLSVLHKRVHLNIY